MSNQPRSLLRTSSPRARTILGVLVALGLLVGVGRFQAPRSTPAASARTGTAAPTPIRSQPVARQPSPGFAEPIGGLAVTPGAVWVAHGQTVSRLDPHTLWPTATIALHGLPDAVGAGPSGVWVRGAFGPVWRIDPATNRLAATITVPGGLGAITGRVLVGRERVWVSDPGRSTVYQLDPQHNRLGDERFEATGADLMAAAELVAAADETAWVAAGGGLRLIGMHGQAPVRTLVADDPTANDLTALAAGAGGTVLWAGTDMGTVLHLDPRQ